MSSEVLCRYHGAMSMLPARQRPRRDWAVASAQDHFQECKTPNTVGVCYTRLRHIIRSGIGSEVSRPWGQRPVKYAQQDLVTAARHPTFDRCVCA